MQDSLEDWEKEATSIGTVYAGALINLSVAGASNSDIGCFHTRESSLLDPCIAAVNWGGLPEGPGTYFVHNSHVWEHAVNNMPLLRRSWVLLERLLANRVLHFGSEQLA